MASVSLTTLFHIARSGMLAQQFSIDTVAANVANINTVGYKRTRAEFQELLSEQLEAPAAGNNLNSGQAAGSILAANPRFFQQGRLESTEKPWDLAIEGEGFFQIQQADGTMAYTRDGTFKLDGEGRIVNADGNFLVPQIVLPPDAEEAMITPAGEVMVRRRGEAEPEVITTLSLAKFTNPTGLENIGDNLFQSTEASGLAQVVAPQTAGAGQIISGALEQSNVDLSQEIVSLISAQRAYSLMARAMTTSDQMISLANQMRG